MQRCTLHDFSKLPTPVLWARHVLKKLAAPTDSSCRMHLHTGMAAVSLGTRHDMCTELLLMQWRPGCGTLL